MPDDALAAIAATRIQAAQDAMRAERVADRLRRATGGSPATAPAATVAAVEAELATWDADPPRVGSLAGWDWCDAAAQTVAAAPA